MELPLFQAYLSQSGHTTDKKASAKSSLSMGSDDPLPVHLEAVLGQQEARQHWLYYTVWMRKQSLLGYPANEGGSSSWSLNHHLSSCSEAVLQTGESSQYRIQSWDNNRDLFNLKIVRDLVRAFMMWALSTQQWQQQLGHRRSFKGTVAGDFWPLVFSWIDPIWAPNSYPKTFSNSGSNSRRYSNLKVVLRCIRPRGTQKIFFR